MDELNIEVTPLVEDLFFVTLSLNGEISQEEGRKAFQRMEKQFSEIKRVDFELALNSATQMRENIKKYGKPCNEW